MVVGRGFDWVKMLATMVDWQRLSKKHWLKCPKFEPRCKWFKISYLEFFFWRYFGHTTFLYSSTCSSQYQSFFISDFLAKSLKANRKWQRKDHSFYMTVLLKKTHFMNLNSLDIKNNMLQQHNQKPFWLDRFSS